MRHENDNKSKSISEPSVFNWKHLKDTRLYTDNDYAVETLKNGIDFADENFTANSTEKAKIIYHCYWFGEIGRKQAFSIKSLLCTQNMDNCKVILWLDKNNGYENHEQNSFLIALLPYIEVKAYDYYIESENTPWGNDAGVNIGDSTYHQLVARADAFRYIELYKHGGIYFDLDILFLKDFAELLHSEFCYAWETQPFANSALFNLKQKSPISTYLLHKTMKKRAVSPWLILLYEDQFLKDLCVLPCAFFDPIWQGLPPEKTPLNDFEEFFKPFNNEFINKFNIHSYKDFFTGCYAFHWHNQWKTAENGNSFFGIFEKEFNKLIEIKSLHQH